MQATLTKPQTFRPLSPSSRFAAGAALVARVKSAEADLEFFMRTTAKKSAVYTRAPGSMK